MFKSWIKIFSYQLQRILSDMLENINILFNMPA